ncbi:hypothetical protein [Alicyclobacillus macrosporangiidus]|uniref:hypothetical protein n=1 Tax=Alicyclobacillus macrosporangiidus TaxID=392015 RepID=UPI000497A359|nr:hypothetical protein [Alicyclobacillus macrosporangiidus]
MYTGQSLSVYEGRYEARRVRKTSGIVTAVSAAAGVAVVWAANHWGWWYVGVAVGVVLGLVLRGTSRVLWAAGLAGFLGWLLPLGVRALNGQPVGRLAERVAGVLGIGTGAGAAIAALAVTGVFGALLCLCGAWLGAALRRVRG